MIDENEATEEATSQLGLLREDQRVNPQRYKTPSAAASTGPNGIKVPPKYMVNPDFDPMAPITEDNPPVIPIPGVNQMGAIESRYQSRIQVGANSALNTLKNIVALPAGVDAGFMGVGAAPGESIFASTVDTLRNKVADQGVQDYNAFLAGLDRNLATVEGAGQIASDALAGSYSNLQLRSGDTEFTRLRKLAEMKQTVISGLEPHLHNDRIPREQRQFMQSIIEEFGRVIPFTHEDVTALEQSQNPQMTIADVIKARGLGTPDLTQKASMRGATNTAAVEPDRESAPAQSMEEAVVANGDGKYTAEGKVVDGRGWVLRRDGGGNYAWVNPANPSEYEEVAQ
jgi:hypothetical protein